MFEELNDIDSVDVNELENSSTDKKSNYKNISSWQNRNNDNNDSSNKWSRKENKIEKPYIPVAVYVDREFPSEIKNSLYNISSKLIAKGITIRINGDDKDFLTKLQALSDIHIEVYIPWRNFNEINSKHYFNTATSKDLARKHFPGYDRITDAVKAMLARNVRMIFGDNNKSIALCLITWSKDGASRISEVTKETGKSSFIIRLASSYGFPVINIAKQTAKNILEKTFGL